MNKYIFIILALNSFKSFGQINLFDTLTIDSTTKIVGTFPLKYDLKNNPNYNFILDDSVDIAKFKKTIKIGTEVKNQFEWDWFSIKVIKNQKQIGNWIVSPNYQSVLIEGKSYKINFYKITKLNKKFPFEIELKSVNFKTKEDYYEYLAEVKKDSNFLYDYEPQFKYEGSFEMDFVVTEQFPSPKAISEYLYSEIDKIVDRSEYRVMYKPDLSKVSEGRKTITITIEGPKKIFYNLKIDNHVKKNWQKTIEYGMFYFRKQI